MLDYKRRMTNDGLSCYYSHNKNNLLVFYVEHDPQLRTKIISVKANRYALKSAESMHTFEFISEGPSGIIAKLISFEQTETQNIFNLAFGDKNHQTGEIDDHAVTHNHDTEKVLATVALAVLIFTDRFPNGTIYIEGSTASRNRLYRIGISKFHSEITNDFIILGLRNEQWESFQRNLNYECFVVKRKPIL
jgi:hypothetical protein